MHLPNVFISYHHHNDQWFKEALVAMNQRTPIFTDGSVSTNDIPDYLSDEAIRERIRDDYLRDTTVTIVLVGTETKRRKHVDWEIYSSMYDGHINKKSGILVINLPTINCDFFTAQHEGEKSTIYPENSDWMNIDNRAEYERRYPYMPERIIDNLMKPSAKISVVDWNRVTSDLGKLRFLINATHNDRASCAFDLSRPMRRANS